MSRGMGGNASLAGGKASLSDMLAQYEAPKKGLGGAQGIGSNYFTCTVGQKPSKAKFFLHDVEEVSELFEALKTSVATTMNNPNPGLGGD